MTAPPSTSRYWAKEAMLTPGWAKDVLIEVNAHGLISQVVAGQPVPSEPGIEHLAGPVIPGMPNLHSHAFQRAMAGTTQQAGPQGESFWSWRAQMYRFLDRMTPDDLEAIAAFVFVEMLEGGYTSVAEFHYLHHAPDGTPYTDYAEMATRIIAAAEQVGIGLTLLPVWYRYGGFGKQPPLPGQRRFLHRLADYESLIARLQARLEPGMRLGLAPHSLRAVDGAELADLRAVANQLAADTPWHIHAAEQMQEVTDCLAATGRRPIQWLLEDAGLNRHWCVVHATHMNAAESSALAASGAVAGLCPSTEADLGDGLFDVPGFLGCGGVFGLGSDSHVATEPFGELRLLEYGQRLIRQQRNVAGAAQGQSVGAGLYRRALAGGAQALAQPTGQLSVGARADWLVLNVRDPSLSARHGDALLDAAIFAPRHQPVADVMVAGRWVVRAGVHRAREAIERRYVNVLERLLAST